MPDLLFRLGRDGQPAVQGVRGGDRADRVHAREDLRHRHHGSRSTTASSWRRGGSRPPSNLDIATIQEQELAMAFRFHLPQYLSRRAADWKARGFAETLVDFPALNARSKFWGDDQRAAFRNWEEVSDPRNPLGGRQGVNERIMLRELLRRVDMMVILENHLDALVRLHTPFPPGKIGGAVPAGPAPQPAPGDVLRAERGIDGGADPGGLRDDRLRSGLRRSARTARATCRSPPARRPPFRSRDCRSPWCSGPSRAGKTSSCASPRPMRRRRGAAFRRPRSVRFPPPDLGASVLVVDPDVPGLPHEQEADHERHQRHDDRVPEAGVDDGARMAYR